MLQPQVIEIITSCILQAKGSEIAGYLLKDNKGKQSFYLFFNALPGRYQFFVTEQEFSQLKRYASINHFELLAFVHSHFDDLHMSIQDREAFDQMHKPWIIVRYQDGVFDWKKYDH